MALFFSSKLSISCQSVDLAGCALCGNQLTLPAYN